MSLFALFFLLVGFSATGATREEIYKRDQAKCGGRCACATAMAWCVVLDLRLCGGDAQQFCALSSTARSWYIIGWVGTCLVILGLAFFLAILSANYAHVGNASKYVELRDLALETPTGESPHLKSENAFHYPRRPSSKDQLSELSNGGYSRQPPYSGSTSSSRLAEKMSDSLSQYAYRPHKRPF
ncbi:hypothetical protein ANCCEY_05381 [Ancylostoma ceylanicum]|uniref:Uncharacterized protein n=1 Tax=Ancylostoma ceylanicum TaxID=53326 RepID=A0A0D6LTX6_9BILA|nr:hypothetical protein ANCCEY_05381 [Ancylostoma ceylanicum]